MDYSCAERPSYESLECGVWNIHYKGEFRVRQSIIGP